MSLSTSTVSEVVQQARGIFSKRKPSKELSLKDVQALLQALGQVTVSQVGLAKQAEEERKKTSANPMKLPFLDRYTKREPITYFHIYECADFTVGIFCIPKGESMPIHDHPDMTVCSKVLYGKVHVEAYDKAPDLQDRLELDPAQVLAARQVTDTVVSEDSEAFALFCESNNIHRFSAVESCAILDVLGPPYDSEEGREIAYYRKMLLKELGAEQGNAGPAAAANGDNGDVVVLQKVNPPSDYVVEGREYTGEQVK